MIELLKKLYRLHRTLVSDDTDKALDIIAGSLPKENTAVHEYEVGSKAWTWKIPHRYKVNRAILKDADGVVYADFSINPLYLWSYSLSIKKSLYWKELENHLYYSEKRPDAIPWYFKFYDKTWGFSVEYNKYVSMPRNKEYFVDIDVEFLDTPGLKVLTHYIDYGQEMDFLVATNVCHPFQVNDSISGLVVAIELAK